MKYKLKTNKYMWWKKDNPLSVGVKIKKKTCPIANFLPDLARGRPAEQCPIHIHAHLPRSSNH